MRCLPERRRRGTIGDSSVVRYSIFIVRYSPFVPCCPHLAERVRFVTKQLTDMRFILSFDPRFGPAEIAGR
jgi:hypothetical protein